ncbi:hypothetical protein HU200_030740 [Digitaria exilis]|uniref:Major facilitator superfamily (MFS) profile domain-containing protein n=1 Tax=Digitaria exilis TaxID=1010633 RepID=A0A835ES04_9POAL|nr:hypothetical protein HU200_030740 [Digitaria exilis]
MGEPPPQPPSPAPAKVYYDGCPGCAMDKKKETHKGVPYKELLFVGITSFASGTCVIYDWQSVKYWMAIATRFLLGALNGFLAPVKAYSIEVCQPEQQALGISIVNTAWGMGVIIGPTIGGYLAQPAKQYPNLFHENSVFGRNALDSFNTKLE